MTSIIFAFLKRFGGWFTAALSIAGAFFITMLSLRSVGKAEAKSEIAKQETKRNEEIAIYEINEARNTAKNEVETIKGASDVKTSVNSLDIGDAVDKLRNKWSRD